MRPLTLAQLAVPQAMLLRRAASLLSGRSALAQRLPSLVRAPPPLLGGLLHARHVYTPPKAENSPPAPGERLAVLFPRGKRMQVSMEVKKRVLKVRPPSPSPAPSPRLPATAAQPQRAAPTPLVQLCPPLPSFPRLPLLLRASVRASLTRRGGGGGAVQPSYGKQET